MTTINNLRYAKQLGENASYVFIDGVCVKSRTGSKDELNIEEALATGKSVLIQEGTQTKIYVDNEGLNYYKSWVNSIKDTVAEKGRSMYGPLVQAFKDKKILVITEDYKDGYQFT